MERCDEMRFISWNIDSLNAALTGSSARAELSRAVLDTIQEANADVIAIQETKLSATGPTAKHREALADLFPDYTYAWVSSQEPARKGYAGNMVLYKETLSPKVSYPTIGAPAPMDLEGRLITLEFEDFYFNQVYTPNAGNGLVRLSERQVWDEKYAAYLSDLDQEKPVIATGDFNVAHREIDLANPAANRRSPGFTDSTSAPTCSTMPTISCPTVIPGTARGTLPCFICKSLVHMLPSVTRTIASRASSNTGIGFSSNPNFPCSI